MQKTFTSAQTVEKSQSKAKNMGPKKSTLQFLQQFARGYRFEPRLSESLGGYMAN